MSSSRFADRPESAATPTVALAAIISRSPLRTPGAQAHAAWNAAVALWEGPKVPAMAGSEDDWTDGPCRCRSVRLRLAGRRASPARCLVLAIPREFRFVSLARQPVTAASLGVKAPFGPTREDDVFAVPVELHAAKAAVAGLVTNGDPCSDVALERPFDPEDGGADRSAASLAHACGSLDPADEDDVGRVDLGCGIRGKAGACTRRAGRGCKAQCDRQHRSLDHMRSRHSRSP